MVTLTHNSMTRMKSVLYMFIIVRSFYAELLIHNAYTHFATKYDWNKHTWCVMSTFCLLNISFSLHLNYMYVIFVSYSLAYWQIFMCTFYIGIVNICMFNMKCKTVNLCLFFSFRSSSCEMSLNLQTGSLTENMELWDWLCHVTTMDICDVWTVAQQVLLIGQMLSEIYLIHDI